MGTQHGGVQSVFRCLHLKKWANFAIKKNAITRPKIVKNAQNQSHPTCLSKTYFHSKFQLIWSSNGRENPKWSLFGGSPSLLWSEPPKKCIFWIFSAIWWPNELKFRVNIVFLRKNSFFEKNSFFFKKVSFFDFLGHLKAKWAEIWCEHSFLMDGLGDLDFGHFWPFLAELWQKN